MCKNLFSLFSAITYQSSPSVTASIPSKYQTFFTSNCEPHGFNTQSTRFNHHVINDHPGPGNYSVLSWQHDNASFSKRGTSGFASKARRFPHNRSFSLGPGAYNPSMPSAHVDFSRAKFSRNFQTPIVDKHECPSSVPAPNSYNIPTPSSNNIVSAVAAFKSQTKRYSLSKSCVNNPGPGQYTLNDELVYPTSCSQKANFLSKTNRPLIVKDTPGPADYILSTSKTSRPIPYYRQKHYLCISAPAIPLPPLPPSPGPGHYEIVSSDSDTHLVTGSVFKSTSCRSNQLSTTAQEPGPGSYEPRTIGKQSFLYNTNHYWV